MEGNEENVVEEVVQPVVEEKVEGVVVEEATPPQEPVEPVVETPEIPPAEVPAVLPDVDELGVPYKNRYMEMKRKNEATTVELGEIKEMVKGLQTSQQQPKHTKEQLMEFIAKEETEPGHRTWALQELNKLEDAKVSETIKKEFSTYEQKQTADKTRADTFSQVIQRHPELILKDAAGQMVGWNTKNPLLQRVDFYMADPELANNPRGLRVAVALAKEDLSGGQASETSKLKAKVKTLQKATLVEGGGKPVQVAKTSLRKAVEESRDGTMKSGTNAMSEILKKQGLIK